MASYTGQTRTALGQLCAALWDSQSRPDVLQSGFGPGTVVTPLALRCSAVDRCVTREPSTDRWITKLSVEQHAHNERNEQGCCCNLTLNSVCLYTYRNTTLTVCGQTLQPTQDCITPLTMFCYSSVSMQSDPRTEHSESIQTPWLFPHFVTLQPYSKID